MSEDLEEIIERAFFEAFNNGKSTKGVISKAIKDAGYCKFPVEKLKRWLEELIKLNKWEGKNKPKSIFQVVLDKIKELENENNQSS